MRQEGTWEVVLRGEAIFNYYLVVDVCAGGFSINGGYIAV